MREHVCARCGDFLLLFPAENIGFIEPVPAQTQFGPWLRRRRDSPGETVLDVRRLLDVAAPADAASGVLLRWHATGGTAADGGPSGHRTQRAAFAAAGGGARQLTLLVDAVEEIVNCYAGDLIDVPILPRRLRPLCDQVMRDPSGRLRLRVKPDVQLPFERMSDRRRFALALLTTGPIIVPTRPSVGRPARLLKETRR